MSLYKIFKNRYSLFPNYYLPKTITTEKRQDPWRQEKSKDNPWENSDGCIDNPLVENVHQTNHFDNSYTKTFANPDPKPKTREQER